MLLFRNPEKILNNRPATANNSNKNNNNFYFINNNEICSIREFLYFYNKFRSCKNIQKKQSEKQKLIEKNFLVD